MIMEFLNQNSFVFINDRTCRRVQEFFGQNFCVNQNLRKNFTFLEISFQQFLNRIKDLLKLKKVSIKNYRLFNNKKFQLALKTKEKNKTKYLYCFLCRIRTTIYFWFLLDFIKMVLSIKLIKKTLQFMFYKNISKRNFFSLFIILLDSYIY
eukprot:TRINITY_DN35654_c0_g2_i1.p3 TRINITY_DN35654_c0_g2~~TRINITY_DN35654_c0_g2_i1.p3  ORF type:complete len:151 (-),score=8.36 TRINITY_DN35654_c0_g2_i1:767-1219(-)